jgi:hypothetical protein
MISILPESNSASDNKRDHLDPATVAVLHTIMYFDVFKHPLTTDEIHHNCQWHSISLTETATALEILQQLSLADEEEGYWFLKGNNRFVKLRNERQDRAVRFQQKAKKYSSFIGKFPFVRGVCISGSLSKGTMDKDGDIDYFIITQPRRLWIARTFLVLFKKIFLLNSKKYFCVNYFVDTDHLSIPDRNLFVATEIAFIRPMVNGDLYNEFMKTNHWTTLFYPNREKYGTGDVKKLKSGFIKRTIEKMFNGKFGEWLDEKLLRITLNRWKKKFRNHKEINFEVDFRSRKHVSKHHPQGFQHKVSLEMERRRNMIFENSGIAVPAMRWEWVKGEA